MYNRTRPLKKALATIGLLSLSFQPLWSHEGNASLPSNPKNGLSFIENKGQWVEEAKFRANLPGGVVFMTDKGFVYNFVSEKDLADIHAKASGKDPRSANNAQDIVHHHAYRINFVGANAAPKYVKENKRSFYHNYFIGNDRSKWAGNVGLYGSVEQQGIYDGINMKVYSSTGGSSMKYDFIVSPGADPNMIAMSFEGVSPTLDRNGNLIIKTSVNEVHEKAPYSYQVINGREVAVKSAYKLTKGVLQFAFPEGYDANYPLVIDPDLVFATFSGGSGSGSGFYAHTTSYDSEGNLYAGTKAYQAGWPTGPGSFQANFAGGEDAGVNKYTANGTNLIYSTYIGGSSTDHPLAMLVNALGELTVVGYTSSTNFPVSAGCFQGTLGGGFDIFVTHLNSTATNIIGSTYVGGSGTDPVLYSFDGSTTVPSNNPSRVTSPLELAYDGQGNIWVVGNTNSTNFPTTTNAQQATLVGGTDVVLFKLNPTCSTLMYSSYLGGTGTDSPSGLIFNNAGNLVMSGYTNSTNFPVTPGAMITTAPGGTFDGFVAIINPANGAISQATYVGTNNNDQAIAVRADCADNIYVMGRTLGNYPVSSNVWSRPNGDVFIDKLKPNLSGSLLSTRLGNVQSGSAFSAFYPSGFLVDVCGNIYVGGDNSASGMPLTPDAVQAGQGSFWLCTLEPNFNDLAYATYLGTTGDHSHIGINRFDPDGFAYYSICCSSTTYPGTNSTVWAETKQTGPSQDIVSFKFNFEANPIKIKSTSSAGGMDTATHCIRGCKSAFVEISRLTPDPEPLTVKYLLSGTATRGYDYQDVPDSIVIPANQLSATLEIKPLLIPNPSGVKEAIISFLSPCGCDGGGDQIVEVAKVRIYDSLFVNIVTPPDTVCPLTPITITAEIDPTLEFTWMPDAYSQGSLTINPVPLSTTKYYITVTQPGAPTTCPPRTAVYEVFVEPIPQVSFAKKEYTMCYSVGDSLDITSYVSPAGTNYNYKWEPADNLRDDHSLVNRFHAPLGDYYRTLVATTPVAHCMGKDSVLIHVVPPFKFLATYPSRDTTIKYGDSIQLDTKSEAIYWMWSPLEYIQDDPLAKNPMVRPLETTVFQVIGIDRYGCRDTADILVKVIFESVANIPNAFSPNGDGHNDVFRIENPTFEKMTEFKIFNRYGQMVYDGKDPAKGWDGNINGNPAPSDVYYYQIRLTFPGGEQRVFKGDVTLIR